jgi:hypothetical protein
MAHSNTLRTHGTGAALVVLATLACLLFAEASDTPTCSLSELASRESVLMSCEDASPVSAELMWCSDPSSPQCLPAAPQVPNPELWDRPDIALPSLFAAPRLGYVWMTWPEADAPAFTGRAPAQRLERPPRA